MGIFSKSPKKKEELMLVFNIGSSSVGASLFATQDSGIPRMIFSVVEPLPLVEKIDVERFLATALKALDVVACQVECARLGAPSRVFCVLSSPWFMSQTRTIKYKKNSPFVFTEKLADELIAAEIKIFGDEYLSKYPEGDSAVRPIELKNLKTVLNGYEVLDPLEQKAKELEMHIFVSVSGEKMLKNIESTIGKYFHFNEIKFSSFAMVSFAVVRDIYPKQPDFLLVDIGGEITDIFMIKKDVLRESISFPLGRNFLTRGISESLGCTLSEAHSLFALYKDGHAEAGVAKKLEAIIVKLKKDWLNKFQESLANLSKDISIPSVIYFLVDKDMILFFSEIIKSEQFSQYTLTESKFEVTFMGSPLLHEFAKFEEKVIREPFLIMDSIYINRYLTKK